MGNRISAVHGVHSPNFFTPGRTVNETWFDNVDIILRLPLGDSGMGQAAWPNNDHPKIPWHPFVILLRAAANKAAKQVAPDDSLTSSWSSMQSSNISRHTLAPTPLNNMMMALNKFADPFYVLLLLAIPFLIAPIAIYHWRRTHCTGRHLDYDRQNSSMTCPKPKRRPAFSHALLTQGLGDAGMCLTYGAMILMRNGNFRLVDGDSKLPAACLLGVQLVSLVSRVYLLCIWFQYFRARSFQREDITGGEILREDMGLGSVSEKADSFGLIHTIADVQVPMGSRKDDYSVPGRRNPV